MLALFLFLTLGVILLFDNQIVTGSLHGLLHHGGGNHRRIVLDLQGPGRKIDIRRPHPFELPAHRGRFLFQPRPLGGDIHQLVHRDLYGLLQRRQCRP